MPTSTEARIPKGQSGGGEWTAGNAPGSPSVSKSIVQSSIKRAVKATAKGAATRTPPPQLSAKATRAKVAHKMVDKHIQRYAEEHNEPRFAKAMAGVSFPDSEPVDVVVGKSGALTHGIEVKTMVDNSNQKLTMDRYAQVRKIEWEKKQGVPFHTIVIGDEAVYNAKSDSSKFEIGTKEYAACHDESQRVYYYRRGVAGSARIGAMYKCNSMAELKRLMSMPEADLPQSAQRTDSKNRNGDWKFFTDKDGKGYRDKKSGDVVRPKK